LVMNASPVKKSLKAAPDGNPVLLKRSCRRHHKQQPKEDVHHRPNACLVVHSARLRFNRSLATAFKYIQ
jgi:hypothetical protein